MPHQIGNTRFASSTSSLVKMALNSVLVQPLLDRKFLDKTKTHFLHSLIPFSIDSRKGSPSFKVNSSYQTGHISFDSSMAIGRAISSLSRESCDMNAKGFSKRSRSLANCGPRN